VKRGEATIRDAEGFGLKVARKQTKQEEKKEERK